MTDAERETLTNHDEPIGYIGRASLQMLKAKQTGGVVLSADPTEFSVVPVYTSTPASVQEPVAVKALEWESVTEDGRDVQSLTVFGTYVISVDSSFAGGTHYLWTPAQKSYDDEHDSEHRGMTSAKAAAQSHFDAAIRSALTTSPSAPAPEIAALRAENERLRMALMPFANDASIYDGPDMDDGEKSFNDNITIGDIRRARAALAPQQEGAIQC